MRRRAQALLAMLAALALFSTATAASAFDATAAERRCYTIGDRIHLTFDDGADPERVRALLDVLGAKGVRAGFFVIGRWAAANPGLVERMTAEGHWLGNHTASHANLSILSDPAAAREIAGGVRSELVRPPYGAFDSRVRALIHAAGARPCLWDIDTSDWRGRSAGEIQQAVFRDLRPGAVVLMHLHGRHTLEALPGLIDGIRSRGLELDALERYSAGVLDPATGSALLLDRSGRVTAEAAASFHGGVPDRGVELGDAVSIAAHPNGGGYWVGAADGGVHGFGSAEYLGSLGGTRLTAPVVGMVPTPNGRGYWQVAADGGVFAHGQAEWVGSAAGLALSQPVVGMAAFPGGRGYWLVGRDGGIFTFGAAPFLGSTGDLRLAEPVVGMAVRPQGDGYWLLGKDGGIFAFGRAEFIGSYSGLAAQTGEPSRRFLSIVADADGLGYWLVSDVLGQTYHFR